MSRVTPHTWILIAGCGYPRAGATADFGLDSGSGWRYLPTDIAHTRFGIAVTDAMLSSVCSPSATHTRHGARSAAAMAIMVTRHGARSATRAIMVAKLGPGDLVKK